jgi:hypothetical protein
MHHSNERILTRHVGSLVRTPQIVECQIRASRPSRWLPDNGAAHGPIYI